MARIALIVGSVREKRQGIKVARWMEGKLKGLDHTVYLIYPHTVVQQSIVNNELGSSRSAYATNIIMKNA